MISLLFSFIFITSVVCTIQMKIGESNVNNPADSDLFKTDKNHDSVSYNIGDLLNMPTYTQGSHAWPWTHNHTSHVFWSAKATAAKLNNTNTILNYYLDMYKNLNYSLSDRYPILQNVYESVRRYGEHAMQEHKLPKHFEDVRKNTTLLVHIRSGDTGVVPESHIEKIVKLSKNFSRVVVMGGAHNTVPTKPGIFNTSAHIVSIEIHKIVDRINNITTEGYFHNKQHRAQKSSALPHHFTDKSVIHYGTNPDDDIYLMSVAANLMLHKGGYTALGGMVCQGRVYFVKELSYYYNNPEYMREIKHPVMLF